MTGPERKRRVLIIVQNLPVPFDRRVWLEATTLAQHGYIVSIICPKAKGFDRSRERLENVEIFRYALPIEGKGPLSLVAESIWCLVAATGLSLRISLFGTGFDILHVCNPPEIYWPLAAAWRLFGKIFLFDHHDLSPEMAAAKFGKERGPLISLLLMMEKLTFRTSQIVVTTNERHKRIAVQRGGKAPSDIYVVRSGPDLSRFKRYRRDPTYRKQKRYLLTYLGEICEQDGVDYMVRAIKILHYELHRSDFHCVLIGGGPHQPVIVKYAEEQGIGHLCTFMGRVSDEVLCRVLSSADVAIDPDPKTAWSDASTMNKIIEYMYFGLPIVAFDLAEARVSADDAAIFVQPNEERRMAEVLARLLDDPQRRETMGDIGRRRVETMLAWDYSVAPLLAAYDAAWTRRPCPARTRGAWIN
jgi:glycosyltransferase involved in cell wall biosynthesis